MKTTEKEKKFKKQMKELIVLRIFVAFITISAASALYMCHRDKQPKEIIYRVFKEECMEDNTWV